MTYQQGWKKAKGVEEQGKIKRRQKAYPEMKRDESTSIPPPYCFGLEHPSWCWIIIMEKVCPVLPSKGRNLEGIGNRYALNNINGVLVPGTI